MEMLCPCASAEQGGTCKHMLKALLHFFPHLKEKKMHIITALGTNKGTPQSGIMYLLRGCTDAQATALEPQTALAGGADRPAVSGLPLSGSSLHNTPVGFRV